MNRLPVTLRARVLARCLLIQAAWNPRTMLGHGVAYILAPVMRFARGREGEDLELARHIEHFNAHPYLSSVALGAVARMEVDAADPERIRRFKTAVRGPLGAIGDRLIWVGWLPSLSLGALTLLALGVSGPVVVLIFLAVYNVGHGFLRVWGWNAGYSNGEDVARAIRDAGLQEKAQTLTQVGALMIGCLAGTVLSSTWTLFRGTQGQGVVAGLTLVGAGLFLLGIRARRRGWRPSLSLTALLIGLIAVSGALFGGPS
ncbi:MAG: hypothetical protein HKO53_17145 [Gemmatimonadetes bacterium]|nr:hypothetical protein [Gemmatimonadota bacterium]